MARTNRAGKVAEPAALVRVAEVLAELRALGSPAGRAGMARVGINTARAFGVPVPKIRQLARKYRRQHALAAELWASGCHEARILAGLIDDSKLVTPEQMDVWVADFDSWDVCDQVCLHLFVATPHAIKKVRQWAKDEREFVRRAAFATIASYCVHAKEAPDAEFLPLLKIIEAQATDPRNYVKKAVHWALRQIGKRSLALHAPSLTLARQLAASGDKTAQWVGKIAARELTDPKQLARLQKKG